MAKYRSKEGSYLLRRSGIALGLVADALGWEADLVVQVGIGLDCEQKEIPVLREVFPSARFIGFEPHPEIVAHLRKNKSYPGEIVQVAISNKAGKQWLYWSPTHKDGASLLPWRPEYDVKHGKQARQLVGVSTLDRQVPSLAAGDDQVLLWLDCEGVELDVLRGGEEFVRSVDCVNVELATDAVADGWADPCAVYQWLADRGFWHLQIHTHRMSLGQTDNIFVREHLFDEKRCCVPSEVLRWRKAQ